MERRSRLEYVYIAFDDDGVKGAHACDCEFIVDGDEKKVLEISEPRPIDPSDVEGVVSSETLQIAQENLSLRGQVGNLTAKLAQETATHEKDKKAVERNASDEIAKLKREIAARDREINRLEQGPRLTTSEVQQLRGLLPHG